jgi:hypothetical protein
MSTHHIEPTYVPRFVPPALVPALLHCWRLTSVGHAVTYEPPGAAPFSRYGRLLRAVRLFEAQHPGVPGAYKDLDGLLGHGVAINA